MRCAPLDCGVPDPSLVNHAAFSCSEGTTFLKRCSASCVPPAKLQGTVWPAGNWGLQGPSSPSLSGGSLGIFPAPQRSSHLLCWATLFRSPQPSPRGNAVLPDGIRGYGLARGLITERNGHLLLFLFDCVSSAVKQLQVPGNINNNTTLIMPIS